MRRRVAQGTCVYIIGHFRGKRGLVVGALSLDVSGLLALVAHLLASGRALGAVAREVAGLATVVALAAVHAVAWMNGALAMDRKAQWADERWHLRDKTKTYATCGQHHRKSSRSCHRHRRRSRRRSRHHHRCSRRRHRRRIRPSSSCERCDRPHHTVSMLVEKPSKS